MAGKETTIRTKFPQRGEQSGVRRYTNPGSEVPAEIQFETAYDLDQATPNLSTDNLVIPGSGYVEIEELWVKVSEAFAWTTLEAVIGIVEAGGAITDAIFACSFTTTHAVGDWVKGTYSTTYTTENPSKKLKRGQLYEICVVIRPTGGIVTGQIKKLKLKCHPVPTFATD